MCSQLLFVSLHNVSSTSSLVSLWKSSVNFAFKHPFNETVQSVAQTEATVAKSDVSEHSLMSLLVGLDITMKIILPHIAIKQPLAPHL